MGPAITQELPGWKHLRIRRVGEVHRVKVTADTSVHLREVERQTVRGEVALVTKAVFQHDAGLQDRVAAVGGQVINGKPRPIVLAGHEELALRVCLQSFVRG